MFNIIVQFTGMSVFSIISGMYQHIIQVPSVYSILNDKTNDIILYLQRIDRIRQDDVLDPHIYDEVTDYIKSSYLYGVVQTIYEDPESHFYHDLSPSLKNKLIFSLLNSYYEKFFYFFNDLQNHNFTDDIVVRKILSKLDCHIFTNNSVIVGAGKPFLNLYFLYKGTVTLVDHTFTFQVARLPEESFFGDF
jgi:hypothetical protein